MRSPGGPTKRLMKSNGVCGTAGILLKFRNIAYREYITIPYSPALPSRLSPVRGRLSAVDALFPFGYTSQPGQAQ